MRNWQWTLCAAMLIAGLLIGAIATTRASNKRIANLEAFTSRGEVLSTSSSGAYDTNLADRVTTLENDRQRARRSGESLEQAIRVTMRQCKDCFRWKSIEGEKWYGGPPKVVGVAGTTGSFLYITGGIYGGGLPPDWGWDIAKSTYICEDCVPKPVTEEEAK